VSAPGSIGVTGAGGFIGQHLIRHFAEAGWQVRAFQRTRRAPDSDSIRHVDFTMPGGIREEDFAGLDWLIHGAVQEYGPRHRDADEVNLAAARKLIGFARTQGTRIAFLSTLSAHDEAASHYGRTKLRMEPMFDPERDTVLRLGLVLGRAGGLFGGIVETLKTARVVPLPDGGRQPVQIIAMDDLMRAVQRVVDNGRGGRFEIAHPEVYRIRDLYRAIIERTGAKPLLLPVPLALVAIGVRVFETFGLPAPVTRENVLGLQRMRVFDTAPSLAALDLRTSGLTEAIARLLENG
jgi:NADH dehydrogenase